MLYNFFRFTELDGVILYTILTLVLLKLFPGTGTGRTKYLTASFLGFFPFIMEPIFFHLPVVLILTGCIL